MERINIFAACRETEQNTERGEGERLNEVLGFLDITSSLQLVTSETDLAEFVNGAVEFIDRNPSFVRSDRFFFVHLIAHGDRECIELPEGCVNWRTLGDILRPLNSKLHNKLILNLSSCWGIRAADEFDRATEPPYRAVMGYKRPLDIRDSLVAYITFYHLIEKGIEPPMATPPMNIAAGVSDFLSLEYYEVTYEGR